MEKRDRGIAYHHQSLQINLWLIGGGICLIVAGLLMMWLSEGSIYRGFATGLFLATPFYLLKCLYDRRSFRKQKRHVEQFSGLVHELIDDQRTYIYRQTSLNHKHKKAILFLLIAVIILGGASCFHAEGKPILVSSLSIIAVMAIEYINNLLEDFRLHEYQYSLEREEENA